MNPSKEEIDIVTRAASAFERVGNASAALELRSLSAAAPQVVADERKPFSGPGAWFPVDVLGNPMREYTPGKWENCEWPSAAPVQAQEPVAETYAHTMSNGRGRPDDPAPFETVCVRLLRNDLPADLKLYAAPVQPVAVPDNWRDNLVGLHVSMDVSTGEENGGDRIFGEIEEVMDGGDALVLLAVESSRNFAAPAAQGNAKTTTKQVCTNCAGEGRFYKTVMSDFGSGEREETVCKVCVGSGVVYSAISAKAAS